VEGSEAMKGVNVSTDYEFHEAANIFPLDEEHLEELATDIKKNKQQVPIELLDGKIIDGRRRFKACQIAGVKPQFRHVAAEDPVAYVLSLNLFRRHLSPTQLAMVGARARDYYDERAKERQKSVGGTGKKAVPVNLPEAVKSDARDDVGKAVGVSGKSIDYATKVLKSKNEKLIAAVDADIVSVSTAARASSEPLEHQNAIVERAREARESGHRPRPRVIDKEGPDEDENEGIKRKGVGVICANEAINCLIRIPKNDALRKRGFQIVKDWIRDNP
jgi:major membrane immunogen (membrane-anchored lipoprotein)